MPLPAAFLKNKKSKKVVKTALTAKKALGAKGKKAAPKGNPFADRMAGLKVAGKFGKG